MCFGSVIALVLSTMHPIFMCNPKDREYEKFLSKTYVSQNTHCLFFFGHVAALPKRCLGLWRWGILLPLMLLVMIDKLTQKYLYIYISTSVWTSIFISFFWNWPLVIIAKLAHKYLTLQEIIIYGCEVQSFVSSANYICHCLQIINQCETNETRDRWTILLQCIWYFDWYLV